MHKTITVFAVVFALMALTPTVRAQQAEKVYRVGYLSKRTSSGVQSNREIFVRALHDLGFVEGRNLLIEWPVSPWKRNRVPALAGELVQSGVDVIFATSTTRALAAKNATRKIPIVFLSAVDPVAAGLVESLARPGTNLTGLTHIAPELAGKRLGLLKEINPKLTRIAVLWEPGNLGSDRIWKEIQRAAPKVGLRLHSMEINRAGQLEGAFQEAVKAGSAAVAVALSSLIGRNRKRIVALAKKHRLPAIYSRSRPVRAGGLMSYAPDRGEQYRRAATYVDKILKGAKPADLPVQRPTKFRLVINLKTAKALGITVPPALLLRAHEVIE